MSTILEALKKSEQERRLNDIPTLSDMPAPYEPSRWPVIALSVGLFVLLVFMLLIANKVWFTPQKNSLPQNSQKSSKSELLTTGDSSTEGVVNRSGLVVNVVSYSDDGSKRFAMIDSVLYREGEFVRAGVKVEEIRQDEVVLNVRGEKVTRRP